MESLWCTSMVLIEHKNTHRCKNKVPSTSEIPKNCWRLLNSTMINKRFLKQIQLQIQKGTYIVRLDAIRLGKSCSRNNVLWQFK